MKLKPLTIVALAVIVFSVAWIFYQKKATPKSAEPVVEQVQVTPTPEATPSRPLKQNEKFIGPAGLYITVPEGMEFKQETFDDIKRTMFYIQKSDLSFQMSGIYEANDSMTEQGLEKAKDEVTPDSFKEIVIGDYQGFEGLVPGLKTRYLILVIKDNSSLNLVTVPPTPENKVLLDQILSTISFQ